MAITEHAVNWWFTAANIVTVIGGPFAVAVFIHESVKSRQTRQDEIYQRLSDEYTAFVREALGHSDLHLLRPATSGPSSGPSITTAADRTALTEEQFERRTAMFNILTALFERSYILLYKPRMNERAQRMWQSWNDYMVDWCKRPEYASQLEELLRGEDRLFAAHIRMIAARVQTGQG
jgi:hypothetical protein